MFELLYLTFGYIPPLPKGEHIDKDNFERFDGSFPSVLEPSSQDGIALVKFYMDDIFTGSKTPEEAYDVLRNHLLPRLVFAKLRLSFKKMHIFVDSITALGVRHLAGGIMHTKPERAERIRIFPIPKDQRGVRSFLATVQMPKREVKNFAEIARPLARLTGKVDWQWGSCEQLSFDFLREKCSQIVESYGVDYGLPVSMYCDACAFAGGCHYSKTTSFRQNGCFSSPLRFVLIQQGPTKLWNLQAGTSGYC